MVVPCVVHHSPDAVDRVQEIRLKKFKVACEAFDLCAAIAGPSRIDLITA